MLFLAAQPALKNIKTKCYTSQLTSNDVYMLMGKGLDACLEAIGDFTK